MLVVVDTDLLVVASRFWVEVSAVISDEVVSGDVVVIVVVWPVVGAAAVVVIVLVVDSLVVFAGAMEVVGMAGHITSAPAIESSLYEIEIKFGPYFCHQNKGAHLKQICMETHLKQYSSPVCSPCFVFVCVCAFCLCL